MSVLLLAICLCYLCFNVCLGFIGFTSKDRKPPFRKRLGRKWSGMSMLSLERARLAFSQGIQRPTNGRLPIPLFEIALLDPMLPETRNRKLKMETEQEMGLAG